MKNPAGPLFRGPRFNRPFGMQGICTRFRRLRTKLKKAHPTEDFSALCAYAYRHSVADAAIKKGVSVEQTALLLGTSPDMIHHHYQHAAADVAYMREVAAKAIGV
jgi:integrase